MTKAEIFRKAWKLAGKKDGNKTSKQDASEMRALRSFEATIQDFLDGNLPDTPDAPDKDGNHAKVFEYGDPNLSRASSKGKASSRICVDCFLDRCCEHWTLLEILEEDQILQAFGSWDANGDGNIELDEFVQMISHANPDVKQAKITRAFAAASGSGDYVDKSRLATALLTHGLQLVDKPKDGDNQASGPGPEGETFTPPPAGAAE